MRSKEGANATVISYQTRKNYFTYQVLHSMFRSPIPWPLLAAVCPADGDPPQRCSPHIDQSGYIHRAQTAQEAK